MRIIDAKGVRGLVLYTRQHIDRLEREGKFPKRIRLGPNRVGWLYDEVEAWLQERIDQRDEPTDAPE